ncbi:MAG: TetR/AcrR family transcriptional regulator [Gemmatimonadaceae bacterium]|nr:TetR/AcrR family transcriptional regulator [Gemmatimonadaceae bacterium]
MTRGRPREFDTNSALDQALAVFQRDGFEGASVQALTEAMGICKPSLYAAYGNKEALFIAALRRYTDAQEAHRTALLDGEPDCRRAVALLLHDMVASHARCQSSSACLIVRETLGGTAAAHSSEIREALASAMASGHSTLAARLVRARNEGQLTPACDTTALADYFSAVMSGLSILAKNGASADAMDRVVQTAMHAWPEERSPRIAQRHA